MKPDIIFEDDQIVIVNKPSGLLTIPDRHSPEKPNLATQLQKIFGKIFTVHRLDRETSGIICFAKTAEAHLALSQAFQNRTVKKEVSDSSHRQSHGRRRPNRNRTLPRSCQSRQDESYERWQKIFDIIQGFRALQSLQLRGSRDHDRPYAPNQSTFQINWPSMLCR